MSESATRLLNTLLPMLYALAVAAYALEFFREDRLAGRIARRLMTMVLGLHLVYLALLTARAAQSGRVDRSRHTVIVVCSMARPCR